MPTGCDRLAAASELDVNVVVGPMRRAERNPLVDQNAARLGIIAEFDDVEVAVVAFEKMGLRPPRISG